MNRILRPLSAALVFAAGIFSCGRGDQADPGRVRDLTFVWDAESLDRANGKVQAVNPLPPADTRLLAWTAPGDDGRSGEATAYDARYFTQTKLDELGWTPQQAFGGHLDRAVPLHGEPHPVGAGAVQQWFLPRLDVSETYYFTLSAKDEVDRASGKSNIAGPAQPSLLALRLSTAGGPEAGMGSAVSSVKDLNADKVTDLIVGSSAAGNVYVYHGAATAKLLDEVEVNGRKVRKVKDRLLPAATLQGGAAEAFGAAVAGLGRVNAGPMSDLIVGAPAADAGAGKIYLFYAEGGLDETLAAAAAEVTILGDAPGDRFGEAVVSLGDLNGDSFADFGVTAPGAGKIYVFLGGEDNNEDSTRGALPTGQTASQVAALIVVGEAPGDGFGAALAGAGDLNADGGADLAVSAPAALHPISAAAGGAVYVFYGKDAGQVMFKSDLKDPGSQKTWDLSGGQEADVTLRGTTAGAGFGTAVCSAGDLLKRDLTDPGTDLAVGAPGEGRVYVFYAGTVAGKLLFPLNASGLEWEDQDRHELLEGNPADGFGQSLAGPGDVNLDGSADLVIGLPGLEAAEIFFWDKDQLAAQFRQLLLPLPAGSGAGGAISPAGDMNQDGYADLLLGAPGEGDAYFEF